MKATKPSYLTQIVILTGACFASGWVAKQATFMSGEIALVYPSSGIALAAVLILGYRSWPAVALGSFAYALATATGNAADTFGAKTVANVLGNTVGALTCAYLLQRLISFRNSMDRVKDVAGFVAMACLLGTTLSAAFKVASLLYVGELERDQMLDSLITWWMPNAMGCLILTPFLLSWASPTASPWNAKMLLEGLLCAAGLIGGTLVSFNSWYTFGIQNYPFAYMPYPFLVWAALRFGQRGASTGTFIVAVLAIHALLNGRGPFVTPNERDSLVIIGTYLGILSVANLLLGAFTFDRQRASVAPEAQPAST